MLSVRNKSGLLNGTGNGEWVDYKNVLSWGCGEGTAPTSLGDQDLRSSASTPLSRLELEPKSQPIRLWGVNALMTTHVLIVCNRLERRQGMRVLGHGCRRCTACSCRGSTSVSLAYRSASEGRRSCRARSAPPYCDTVTTIYRVHRLYCNVYVKVCKRE